MRATTLVLVLLLPALAGCARPPPGPEPGDAPTWTPGTWWEMRWSGADAPERTVRPTVFAQESEHWLVGVADAAEARALAVAGFPFLGRVHRGSLALHDGDAHVAMWDFPLADGASFQSTLLGLAFDMRVARTDDGFRVAGAEPGGARASYDWDPAAGWFRHLRVTRGNETLLAVDVPVYGAGATGTFHATTARRIWSGPASPEPHEERFDARAAPSLLLEYDVAFDGPVRIEVVDPSGVVRDAFASQEAGARRGMQELHPAPEGRWTARFLGPGNVTGTMRAVDLERHEGTVAPAQP